MEGNQETSLWIGGFADWTPTVEARVEGLCLVLRQGVFLRIQHLSVLIDECFGGGERFAALLLFKDE